MIYAAGPTKMATFQILIFVSESSIFLNKYYHLKIEFPGSIAGMFIQIYL